MKKREGLVGDQQAAVSRSAPAGSRTREDSVMSSDHTRAPQSPAVRKF